MGYKYDVLVTDADQRVALEIVRSLGKTGLRILAVEQAKNSKKPLASTSKFCTAFKSVSSYSSDEFIDLCGICRTIIPISTNSIIHCFGKAREKFPERFLLPSVDGFRDINDKYSLSVKAKELGLKYPVSIMLSKDDDYNASSKKTGFPLVLKLCNDEGLYLSPADRYRIVNSEEELVSAWDDLIKHNKNILMQEYIDGIGVGFSAIYDEGHNCVTSVQHKRLREYPVSGGPSTYCQSISLQKIEDAGRKLLDNLEWVGPAMVEFKYDAGKNLLVLLEVNPRYWGSLPLARKSGVNIPYIHYSILTGKSPDIADRVITDVRLKFFITDFIAAMKEILNSRKYCSGILKYLSEFFDSKLSCGIWMWSDPLPALRYFFNHLKKK